MKSLIIGVTGTRTYTNKNRVYFELNEIRKKINITRIVTGDATGADAFAIDYAKENKIPYTKHEAQWDDMSEPCVKRQGKNGFYNALAGIKRNTLIVNDSEFIVAFWDGVSHGTHDTIKKAAADKKFLKTIKI